MEYLKYCQIVFEGMNRSGKTTAKAAFEKLTNYKYITIDRGLITGYVMTELFKRPPVDYDLTQFRDVLFIYTYASDETIAQRYIDTDHEEFPWKEEKELFKKRIEELKMAGIMILEYDTDRLTSEEIAIDIRHYMQILEGKDR